jgi:hypothetical protein
MNVTNIHLKCWFGYHNFELDNPNTARKYCSRCGMKSLLMIEGSGKAHWQDISFPDEGFWGLRTKLRFWLLRKIYEWKQKKQRRKKC